MKHNNEAITVLKSLCNPIRFKLFRALLAGSKCVGALANIAQLQQPTISRHLALMRHDRMVVTRRHAQTIFYSIANDRISSLVREVERLYAPE